MIDNAGRASRRGVIVVPSPFDVRVLLRIDEADCEAYIDFHETTVPVVRNDILASARSRGWVEDDDPTADPYDLNVPLGDGMWRTYLTFRDTRPDIPLQRGEMPDLTLTAYGPFSGVMEAV